MPGMMNEAAIKSMGKMIQVMLPYEMKYSPIENSTKTLSEIFILLRKYNPKIDEFKGFFNYIMRKMDEDENLQDSGHMDVMLMEIWGIINKHYPPSDLDYPEDLGNDN